MNKRPTMCWIDPKGNVIPVDSHDEYAKEWLYNNDRNWMNDNRWMSKNHIHYAEWALMGRNWVRCVNAQTYSIWEETWPATTNLAAHLAVLLLDGALHSDSQVFVHLVQPDTRIFDTAESLYFRFE